MVKLLYIFDLDGTLVDAYSAIHKSLNATRKKFSYPPISFKIVKETVGRGDALFIKAFFKPEEVDAALKFYRKIHAKYLKKYCRILPYGVSMLKQLKKQGKIAAIASNRPKIYTDFIVKKLGIYKYFKKILCADEIDSLKPRPKILNLIVKYFKAKKSQTVYIGDMDIDLEAARRAKIDAVFMAGGSSPVTCAAKYKNKKIAYSLKEVIGLYE
jgi:HAD superfamily hydrolase (TIGR01549 family)